MIICLAPFLLVLLSLLCARRHSSQLTLIPLFLAAWLAGTNLYLSFIRPRLWLRRHGSMEGYRFVSGIPIVGNIIVILTLLATLGSRSIATAGLMLLVADTGGLPWFLIATWRDQTL